MNNNNNIIIIVIIIIIVVGCNCHGDESKNQFPTQNGTTTEIESRDENDKSEDQFNLKRKGKNTFQIIPRHENHFVFFFSRIQTIDKLKQSINHQFIK